MARSNALAHTPAMDLLLELRLNKSTVFADDERERLSLTRLLPDVVESEDLQLKRVLLQLGRNTPRRGSNYVPGWSHCALSVYVRLQRAMGLIPGGGAYGEILPGKKTGSTRDASTTIAGVSEFANQSRHGAVQILPAVAELNRQLACCNRTRTRSSSPAGCAAA